MPPQTFSVDAVVACHLIFGMFVGGCTHRKLTVSHVLEVWLFLFLSATNKP